MRFILGASNTDLLTPVHNPSTWIDGCTMIRIDAELARPVGGITVVQHFEVNIQPMQVCITYELISQLSSMFVVSTKTSSKQVLSLLHYGTMQVILQNLIGRGNPQSIHGN